MESLEPDQENRFRLSISRASLYGSLARAFGPDVEKLLTGSVLQDIENSSASHEKDLHPILLSLKQALSRLALDDLKAEHVKLFLKGECSPYESSYDRRFFGEIHDRTDVSGFYAAFGLKPSRELPDHLVSELEFMGFLCLKESYALAHGLRSEAEISLDAQRKFLSSHLARWLPAFVKQAEKKTSLPVYGALAELTQRFVSLDAQHLGVKKLFEVEEVGAGFPEN